MKRTSADEIRALRALHSPTSDQMVAQLLEARVGIDLALLDAAQWPTLTRLAAAERHLLGAVALIGRLRTTLRQEGKA